MSRLIFTSKPNSCRGCPVKGIAPLGEKVGNICHKIQTHYEVEYWLDRIGRQICEVWEKESMKQ